MRLHILPVFLADVQLGAIRQLRHIAVNDADGRQPDNVGAVDPDEGRGLEHRFGLSKVEVGQQKLTLVIDFDVVFPGFHVKNLLIGNLQQAFSIPQPYGIPCHVRIHNFPVGLILSQFSLFPQFDHGPHETLKGNGLHQVVQGGKIVALQSILRVSRGQDKFGAVGQGDFHQLHAGHFGHADVEEDQVRLQVLNRLQGRARAGADGHNFQIGYAVYELFDNVAGGWFVIDNDDSVGCLHVAGW